MFDRSAYFKSLIQKGSGKGRITFIDRQEIGAFDILCDGELVASLTDEQLKFSTPDHVSEMAFSSFKEKPQDKKTPTVVKFVEKVIPKKDNPAVGQVKLREDTPKRGRPKKISLEKNLINTENN